MGSIDQADDGIGDGTATRVLDGDVISSSDENICSRKSPSVIASIGDHSLEGSDVIGELIARQLGSDRSSHGRDGDKLFGDGAFSWNLENVEDGRRPCDRIG